MHSSISSSEAAAERAFVPMRLTASDRPGVAQPVPVRPVPEQPWLAIVACAFALLIASVGAWEAAGGKADVSPKQDVGEVMYGRSFEDPDGHTWEPMWMDPAFAEQGAHPVEETATEAAA